MKRFILLIGVMCLFVTGCGATAEMSFTKDGSCGVDSAKMYLTESEYSQMVTDDKDKEKYKKEKYKGAEYWISDETNETDTDTTGYTFDKDKFYFTADSTIGLFSFYDLVLHFPYKVTETNATILEDGKSISIELDDFVRNDYTIYALFTNKDIKSITESTVKGYKKGKIYKDSVELEVLTDGIFKGGVVTNKYKDKITGENVDKTYPLTGRKFVVSDNGKTIIKYKVGDKTKKIVVEIDKTAPYTNMTDGFTYDKGTKVKIKDNYSGIKSARLNGRPIKNGYVLNKSGTYILKIIDKAGNKTNVTFKVV